MSVTKLVRDAFVMQLICPVCSADNDPDQPMMQAGDNQEIIFCPHCDLILVIHGAIIKGYVDEKTKGNFRYIKHQVEEFIKRWKNEHN